MNKKLSTKTKLRQVIDSQGRKLKWVSKKTGIQYTTLSLIVSGKQEPTIADMEKLAKLLGVSIVEHFFEGKERNVG